MIEGLGTILTGLSAVIIALGTFYSQRSKKDKTDRKLERKQLALYVQRDQVALRHISRLETALAQANLDAPPRPKELSVEWLFGPDEESNGEPKQVTS